MAHLTHKLPWASLAAAIPATPPQGCKPRPDEAEAFGKKAEHLAAVLAATVAEFAATDRRSGEEKEKYDVGTWEGDFDERIVLYGAGACRGYVESVINGYVALNLLVESEARVRAALFDSNWSSTLAVNAGHHDGSHPEWLADKLKPLVDDYGWIPKPLDADVVGGIRNYCAELFRCMYTRPDLFTQERISNSLWVLHRFCYYEPAY